MTVNIGNGWDNDNDNDDDNDNDNDSDEWNHYTDNNTSQNR